MAELVQWIAQSREFSCPIVAAIAHYQFATIHPYYDGNGRTARLLTTLVLHLGGYDLKGLFSLEEYYAKDIAAYYKAISVGPSHNYYFGRAESDITGWIEYFCIGMAEAFENVVNKMKQAQQKGVRDDSSILRTLDPKQRRALELFLKSEYITSKELITLFGFKARTNAYLCQKWVEEGFLEIADASNRGRKYRLAVQYRILLSS
jgi:Fic family protein